jgi:hypothetical protein
VALGRLERKAKAEQNRGAHTHAVFPKESSDAAVYLSVGGVFRGGGAKLEGPGPVGPRLSVIASYASSFRERLANDDIRQARRASLFPATWERDPSAGPGDKSHGNCFES